MVSTREIVLYNNKVSFHAQYARVVLDALGVEYNKVHVELPLENLEPKYAAISPSLSVPAMAVTTTAENGETSTITITDSRDIIMYCKDLPGGDKLFPPDKMKDIEQVLDQLYSANGGQLSFQAQLPRDPLFSRAINILGGIRKKKVKSILDDPNTTADANLHIIYAKAYQRVQTSNPSLEVLSERVNKVMIFLDQKLEESASASGGPWLLGKDYTAADAAASIWVQWIVWARAPKVLIAPRVLEFLNRAKERPSWKVSDPQFVVSYLTTRIYLATAIVSTMVMGGIAWTVVKALEGGRQSE